MKAVCIIEGQMSAQPSRILLTRRLFLDFGARNTCSCI